MLTLFMYHRVLPFAHPEAVSVNQFEQQLDYLSKTYTFLSTEEALSYIRGEGNFRKKNYAALSFDDGWVDNYLYATEILRHRNMPAFLALSVGYLHEGNPRESIGFDQLSISMAEAQRRAACGDFTNYLNHEELCLMHASGVWTIEAHGCVHKIGKSGTSILAQPEPDETLDAYRQRLHSDLSSCCNTIESLTGRRPQAMFWPWGHYSDPAVAVANAEGLNIQFTVSKGIIHAGDRRKIFPRIGVSSKFTKLKKNVFVFRHPLLALFHDGFHTEPVYFHAQER